jgi:hypothetical protein
MFFEVTSKIVKTNEKGQDKEVSEKFFVDNCEFFAEAEARMIEYYNNENNVVAIKASKVREFINEREDEEQDIYIAVIEDTFINDDGESKKTKYEVGLFSENISTANKTTHEYMKQGLNDMELVKIYKTKFLEII